MKERNRNILCAVICLLLWLISYYFVFKIATVPLDSDLLDILQLFLLFLIPILPLLATLSYGLKILQSEQIKEILGALLRFCFLSFVLVFIFSGNFGSDFGKGVFYGVIMIVPIFIIIQLIFGLVFLKLRDRENKKEHPNYLKATMFSFGIYFLFPIILSILLF